VISEEIANFSRYPEMFALYLWNRGNKETRINKYE
jgi:hypothetical protein